MNKREIQYGRGIFFTEDGQVEATKCHIVYGPPAGGKTTYVKENKKRGDLIIDLDYIKQAISLEDKLTAPDNLLAVALSIREHIYGLIQERKINCENIWIVAGLPRRDERIDIQKRLGADLIFINTEYRECVRRSEKDPERKDKLKAKLMIDKWFANYEV